MDKTPSDRPKRVREALGVSQADLAARLGIHAGLLSRLERGLTQSWPRIRRDLAHELGLELQRLWPPDDD